MKKNQRMKDFLSEWMWLYDNQTGTERNQPAFRHALYNSDIRMFPLPRSYNYRLPKIAEIHDEVKIIHGRHPEPHEKIEEIVNRSTESRVITKTAWPLNVVTNQKMSLEFMIRYGLGTYGVVESIKRAYNRYFK